MDGPASYLITRQNIVSDAESFARALVEAGSNTDVIVMSSAEIEKACIGLHMEIWQNSSKFNGPTMSKLFPRVPDETGIKHTGNSA